MGPADEIELVLFEEEVDDIPAVVEAYASLEVVAPPLAAGLGVRPQDVRHHAAAVGLHRPLYAVDAGNMLDEGTEPPVHAEDAVGDNCSHGVEVEAVRYSLPGLDVESSLALVVEAVELVELAGLVVPPQEEEVVGALDLVGHQQADALQGLLAPVDVVTQKQVVLLGRLPEELENSEEVLELLNVGHLSLELMDTRELCVFRWLVVSEGGMRLS